MRILNPEALEERARNLGALNGFDFVLVSLTPAVNPTDALLEVHFHNTNELANIVVAAGLNPAAPRQIFPITGGHRVLAGSATAQVQVTAVAAGPTPDSLVLTVRPIGDYSTYTLHVNFANFDPIFSELPFKFRPGCFSTDCAPDWKKSPPPQPEPAIDYLAKDYDSFKHVMMTAMMQRVPGWQPTSEADLDQVILELFSAASDELSDYQDRVMNEAYLGSTRKRVSLARHARLMDYHIHQGNQASTWIALETAPGQDGTIPHGLMVWTGRPEIQASSQVFISRERARVHTLLNQMGLYSWSGSQTALAAGSTSAELTLAINTQAAANVVRDLIRNGEIGHLVIQERVDPATGNPAGRDPRHRQLLELIPGMAGAESVQDPLTGDWMVRVHWAEKDKLRRNYCFLINCPPPIGRVANVSLFHGNLVPVVHGRPREVEFLEPPAILFTPDQYHFERTDRDFDGLPSERWGTLCRLPDGPLAYLNTPIGGEDPTRSTVRVMVELPSGIQDEWDEHVNLIHSDDSAEGGDHFVVELDEEGHSVLRFGNGVNGRKLPDNAIVHCRYQIGRGIDGNVGSDSIAHFDATDVAYPADLTPPQRALFQALMSQARVWNPFDVTDGRDPEPAAEIVRKVPEAYRYRQLRAVTLNDYVRRAEELPEVSRAAARYMWTGSWRTVRITVDPAGTTVMTDALRRQVARYLNAVRLIGEDLEIRPPRFVPLDIKVALCIHRDYWPEDVRFELFQEFSDGFTPDGRMGFFHPDVWTFGQELYASQIEGRAHLVEGVEHIISISMKRWGEASSGTDAIVGVAPNEILLVRNDPDHMELGFIEFDLRGGRQ